MNLDIIKDALSHPSGYELYFRIDFDEKVAVVGLRSKEIMKKKEPDQVNPFNLINLGRYQVALCFVTKGDCVLDISREDGSIVIRSIKAKEFTDNATILFKFMQSPFDVSVGDANGALKFFGWDASMTINKKLLSVDGKDRRNVEMFLWMSGLYSDMGFATFYKEYTLANSDKL